MRAFEGRGQQTRTYHMRASRPPAPSDDERYSLAYEDGPRFRCKPWESILPSSPCGEEVMSAKGVSGRALGNDRVARRREDEDEKEDRKSEDEM
jgi:hypothetical protein